MTLDDLARSFNELAPGNYPIAGNWCKYCGSDDLVVTVSYHVRDSLYSLAGVQPKVLADKMAVLSCNGCGHVSRS